MTERDPRKVLAGVAAGLALLMPVLGLLAWLRPEAPESARYGDIAPVAVKWGQVPTAEKARVVPSDHARQVWAAAIAAGGMPSADVEDLADRVEAAEAKAALAKARKKRKFLRRRKGQGAKLSAAEIEELMQDPDDEADSGEDDDEALEGDEIDVRVEKIGSQADLLAAIEAQKKFAGAEGDEEVDDVEVVSGEGGAE